MEGNMIKESLPKEASEQPPKMGSDKGSESPNMPGKMKGNKMPHEVMSDKFAKSLSC